jgi:hypothetical protein
LVVRGHRAEMHALGALTRIGRTLVFRGAGYEKWLNANAPRVDYELPMNAPEHAHKRNTILPKKNRRGSEMTAGD